MIFSLNDIEAVAAEVIKAAGNCRKIVLIGPMGAGKTTLVSAICRSLGSADEVSSPTYALINQYEMPGNTIRHMDLYRLKNLEEALDIGIEDMLYDDSWCLIEWPQLIESLLPEEVVAVTLRRIDEQSREASITLL